MREKSNSSTSRVIQNFVIIAIAAVLGACGGANNDQVPDTNNSPGGNNSPVIDEPEGELVQSTLSRELSPSVPGSDAEELAQANQEFALNLYQQLRTENPDENLFLSPHSISIALAMLYAGAKEETEAQIAEALNYTLAQEQLHAAFNALDLELADRGSETVEEEDGEPFELSVVNATWGQAGYPFLDTYLDTLAVNYGAGLRVVDFVQETEASRLRINQWVEEQTNERIKDLLPPNSVSVDTRLILTNAIYFKATWLSEFNETFTQNDEFTRLDGSIVQVPMMEQSGGFAYHDGDGYQAIDLPYVGNKVSMTVILPDAGTFGDFEASLDSGKLDEIIASFALESGTIKLPRFEFESDFSLVGALSALGMADAFNPGLADLSGIDGTRNLHVSEVIHKSFVAVDEEGTEAAAATAVVVGTTSMPMYTYEMTVDRPFLFVIRDNPTGAILFLGSVLDPS